MSSQVGQRQAPIAPSASARASGVEVNANGAEMESNEEQLSKDLALFLSNPKLQAALADGSLDLTSYSSTVEKELYDLESSCVNVYRTKEKEIIALKKELEDCDTIMLKLQEMLLGFQADLSGLSGEIRTLQDKSKTLGISLSNRKLATDGLYQFLSHIILSPNLVDTLANGSVGSKDYVLCVQEFNELYHFVNESNIQEWCANQVPNSTEAGKEMQRHFEQLKWVIIKRIREYFLFQLSLLRRPQTNIRMIQVHGLLQYSVLQDFLQQHASSCTRASGSAIALTLSNHGSAAGAGGVGDNIANEIYNVYIESMSKTLFSLFRTYQIQLLQLDSTRIYVTRSDVIAIDDNALRDSITTKAKKRIDVFCLGSRAKEVLFLSEEQEEDHHDETSTATSETKVSSSPQSRSRKQQPTTTATPSKQNSSRMKAKTKMQQDNAANSTNSRNQIPTLPQPILAHVALAEKKIYPYEKLFRSLLGHLCEAVTNEHIFCRQFFKCDNFNPLFNGTLSLLLEQLENYLFNCYDVLSILLMIKITHQFRRLMKLRTIHSLDTFFNQILHLLWPRLKIIMDNHKRSIKNATAAKLGGVDLHAHYVSRRFAEFACSILLILNKKNVITKTSTSSPNKKDNNHNYKSNNNPGIPAIRRNSSLSADNSSSHGHSDKSAGDMLLQDLTHMVDEYIALLDRMADEHGTGHNTVSQNLNRSRHGGGAPSIITSASLASATSGTKNGNKKRVIFLINNLDQVVCIFEERRVVGAEFDRIVELLMNYREAFVEEELLSVGFSKMIAFVQQTESYLATHSTSRNEGMKSPQDFVNFDVVSSLVKDFKSNWKSQLEQINRNVLSYFSNFRNGMEILKQVLTQMLLYYTRFQDIIRKVWMNPSSNNKQPPPTFCKDLVNTSVILAEIKKYALAI